MKKLALAIAIVAVLAMAFTSVGYAYTASTENSGNSVTSQYVTLTQQNYTFEGGAIDFDVIETEAGIKYQLNGTTYPLTNIEGNNYIGVKIGSDKLSATMTGGTGGVLGVSVSSPQLNSGGFTDYSGGLANWRYVLKASADHDETPRDAGWISSHATLGACYELSENGTLNDGALSVKEGDVVGYDGSAWVLIPDQYAYYSGSSDGMWIVNGQDIESQYRVAAVDADAGGFIRLYSADTIRDVTVVVITLDNETPSICDVYYNEGIILPIDLTVHGEGPWYVDDRVITDGQYTIDSTDTDGGVNVVIYDENYKSYRDPDKYAVVKIDRSKPIGDENRVRLEYGLDAGDPISGVDGWHHGGGIKFNILTGATYTTELYFAGPGGNVNSSLRSEGATIKAPSQITIMPEWVPVSASEAESGQYVKYTLDKGLGTGTNRVVYVKSGSSVMLPENCFTAPDSKVFVGWKADNLNKVFTSEHIYKNFTEERTFTAQWALPSECWKATFHSGIDGDEETYELYYLKDNDSGSTVTLPPYKFTNPEQKFTGWVVQGSLNPPRDYSEYNTYFVDIPAVKENLTVTAQWEEAQVSAEDVSISFGSNTVIKVASDGTATVLSGKHIGDTVAGVNGWYIKGVQITENPYTLRDSDVVHGGYIVIYQTASDENEYSVILVEGNNAIVMKNQAEDAKINNVGGWMVNGSLIYAAPYYVDADNADTRGFIVVYDTTNAKGEYAVIKVPTTSGSPSIARGLHVGDTVDGVGNWYVNGTKILTESYTVKESDATKYGYIILCESDDNEHRYNPANKYTVIKASVGTVGVTSDLSEGAQISGVKGWNVKGMSVGTYTVTPSDAAEIGGGYILLYDNAACDYNVHTGANGSYKLPYCIDAAPEDPGLLDFMGWRLAGWNVIGVPGENVAQSYTMPDGTDGYIVKNGTIKFTYKNDLRNGGAQA